MSHQKTNKNEIRKEIAALIDSIKKQSDHIGFTREIPQVELDLIIHQIERLYRRTVVFSYLNGLPEEIPAPEIVVETPVTPPTPVPQVVAKVETPVIPVVETPVAPKTETPPTPVVEPPIVASIETPITPEPVNVVEEKKPEISLPPKVETPKVETPASKNFPDLKTLIGFNERIMFMRSLFATDASAYDEAIRQINACQSFTEADSFLGTLRNEYRWNSESEPVQIFLDTVKRRFA